MRKFAFCCSLLLIVAGRASLAQAPSAPAGDAPVLTLRQAVALAVTQNKQVQISSLDVSKATENIAETKTQRLPQLSTYILAGAPLKPIDFAIPAGVLGTYPATGPIPAQSADIQTPQRMAALVYAAAAQPLSQLYKIGLAIRESKLGEQLASEQLRQSKQDVSRQVKEAYYQIAQTQAAIDSASSTLKYLIELEALTERNLAQETALKADSLSVKTKVSQQRYQLLTLQDTLDTQKETLNRLLGRDLRIAFSVEVQPLEAPAELDLAAAQKEALDQRSEIRQAHLQNNKAELDVRRERAEYIPDISLQVSYLSLPNINFAPQNLFSAGFLLQWQPYDWGLKKHKTEELRSTSKQATLTVQDAEQQVLLDVNTKFRKLVEARALLDTQAIAQEAEREKLRVMMNRYDQKTALLTDLLQQQSALSQADDQYRQSLDSFWTAKAFFESALGED
jgi:outer membrane protein